MNKRPEINFNMLLLEFKVGEFSQARAVTPNHFHIITFLSALFFKHKKHKKKELFRERKDIK
jgi:hypothetical protein